MGCSMAKLSGGLNTPEDDFRRFCREHLGTAEAEQSEDERGAEPGSYTAADE